MKKIIVTGANGFFASRFIKAYSNKFEIISFGKHELDIREFEKVKEVLTLHKPDYLVHTAAISDTGVCERDPEKSYDINVKGPMNIAKVCKELKCKFINFSSEQVYNGNEESGPYSEEITPVPNTVYGKHKLLAEEEVNKIYKESVHLRLTWLFGFPERNCKVNANIIMNILNNIMSGSVYKAPIHEYRGMTYVYDVIDNMEKIIELAPGVYNVGSENNHSTYEIAEQIVTNLKVGEDIKRLLEKEVERFKDKKRDLRISNKKLKDLGIEFSTTEEGVRKCLSEFNFNR